MWEDKSNCKGGKWRYNVQLKHNGNLDLYWKEMVRSSLSLICVIAARAPIPHLISQYLIEMWGLLLHERQ